MSITRDERNLLLHIDRNREVHAQITCPMKLPTRRGAGGGEETLAAAAALHLILLIPHLLDVPPQVPPAGHVDEYPEPVLDHLKGTGISIR